MVTTHNQIITNGQYHFQNNSPFLKAREGDYQFTLTFIIPLWDQKRDQRISYLALAN